MKRWYLFYYESVIKCQRPVDQIRHQAGDELEVLEKGQQPADEFNVTNRQQAVDEFEEDKKGQQAVGQLEGYKKGQQLADINKPFGVSTYQLEQVMACTVKEQEQRKENLRKWSVLITLYRCFSKAFCRLLE